jgi:hypothetical protein
MKKKIDKIINSLHCYDQEKEGWLWFYILTLVHVYCDAKYH